MMTYHTYREEFESRAKGMPSRPVAKPQDEKYTKLNFSRVSRWERKGELEQDVLKAIHSIDRKLDWILITEPWCGDAAHSVPFIQMMVAESDLISMEIYLRDEYPELMDIYHTNGSHSIPKLVVRDRETKEDLFVWGPRPAELEAIRLDLKDKMEYGDLNQVMQKWYNEDKGRSTQKEILELINEHIIGR